MKKQILGITFALVLGGTLAHAQTTTNSTTTTTTAANGASTTETTTTESSGTITEFTPGASIVLRTEAAEPVHYRFDKSVTYVTEDGKVVEASKVRKDARVRVHYAKRGNEMIVDKVIVQNER